MSAQEIQLTHDLIEALDVFKRAGWNRKIRHKSGLSRMEYILLFHIRRGMGVHESMGITPSALGEHLHITPPTITQHITSLEKKGSIQRSMDPHDRRSVRISLTDSGRKMIQEAEQEHHKILEGLVRHLGDDSTRKFIDLLHQCREYYENLQEDA